RVRPGVVEPTRDGSVRAADHADARCATSSVRALRAHGGRNAGSRHRGRRRMIGGIQTYVPPDRTLPSGAFEIGIVIDEPSMRGQGYRTEALSRLVGWALSRL